MKRFYFVILLFLSINIIDLFSQKENYNWDYGGPYVITFDTPDGEPAILTESFYPHPQEGWSCISNSAGKFLFSTNGIQAFSYIHDKMYINSPRKMFGCTTTTQSALIVKKPDSDSIYYIFTLDCVDNKYIYDHGLNYSIVDISKNNNSGEIISVNNFIYSSSTEKLIAIRHSNGKDVWIISHLGDSKTFYAYLLTKDGLKSSPVKSSTGILHGGFDDSTVGYMKSNLEGNKIALVLYNYCNVNLLKFNNSDGNIESLVNFNIPSTFSYYGVEFSPNSKFLYITQVSSGILYQFDISILDSNSIKGSKRKITDTYGKMMFGAIQLAPNGKIYLQKDNLSHETNTLGVINLPNEKGQDCMYSDTGTTFLSTGNIGLPNILMGMSDFTIKINVDSLCEGGDLKLNSISNPDFTSNKYTWTGPNGFTSTDKNIIIPNAKLSDLGLYKVTMNVNSTIVSDSVNVVFVEKPISKISGDTIICKSGSTVLHTEKKYGYRYIWSTGDSTDIIYVNKAGKVILTVQNQYGCISIDSINIIIQDNYDFKISGRNNICLGDTNLLTTELASIGLNYSWSTGDTSKEIKITKGGKYILKVSTNEGCEGADSIIVEESEKPEIKFEKSYFTICYGDSVDLKPYIINPDYIYHWSDGYIQPERTIKTPSQLFLIAENKFGCSDSSHIQVEVVDMPTVKIIADKTEVCFGELVTLKTESYNPEFDYLWSTGEKSVNVIINQSGKYSLKVSNKNLCIDSTFIDVIIYPDLNLELTSDKTTLCFDDSTVITTKLKYDKYLWSTGDTTESITVHKKGVYKLIVNNKLGCSDTAQIEIFKYNAELASDSENIIFNELCIGNSETKNIKFTLKSNYDMAISNIYLKSNVFSIENVNGYLKSYNDGETFELSVTFMAYNAGEFTDTLIVETNKPCHYIKSIPIYGTSKALFQFSLPNIISQAGNYLIIPLYACMTCSKSDVFISDYEIDISFDKVYFIPDSVKFGNFVYNKTDNQNRIIKIKGTTEFKEKKDTLSPINYLYGMALVGRKEIVPLTIDSVIFTNKRYYPEYINGSLKIEGCVNNIRPIQLFKPTKLSITPNPTDGELKLSIETQEKGSFIIEIFNLQGQCIYTKEFLKSNSSYEEFHYFYDSKVMGSGIYSVHLTSPWNIIRKQLVISK